MADLEIEDLALGTGAEAVSGQRVEVHYTGWLTNGNKFDSSLDATSRSPSNSARAW